jgi:MFS transporter, ACS family, allantoate permease
MSGTSATAWFLVVSLMSSNILGHTKKTTSNAIVFFAQGVAYLVGPLCFTDSPYYHKAKDMTLGLWVLSTLVLAMMWYLNWRENRSRQREMTEKGVSERSTESDLAFHDLTDKVSDCANTSLHVKADDKFQENKGFRYVT